MFVFNFTAPVHEVLGPGDRGCLWLTGCSKRCEGCISPHLQKKENGVDISVMDLYDAIKPHLKKCNGFTISGGEPFDQADELHEFIQLLHSSSIDDILIFSGYELDELEPQSFSGVTAVITGQYINELNCNGEMPWGSSNQQLHILDPRYEHVYSNWVENFPRCTLQNFYASDGRVFSVGMHKKYN